jgi:hypothetical protein
MYHVSSVLKGGREKPKQHNHFHECRWRVGVTICDHCDKEPRLDITKHVLLASFGRRKAVIDAIRADVLMVAKEQVALAEPRGGPQRRRGFL